MAEAGRTTLGDLASEVRSKNAGPFWVTMGLFMRDSDGYGIAADESFLNERTVAEFCTARMSLSCDYPHEEYFLGHICNARIQVPSSGPSMPFDTPGGRACGRASGHARQIIRN